jgi:hypothetical protein
MVEYSNGEPAEALAKLPIDNHCHSERSEESRISRGLRSFTPFRMTEKRLLQEALRSWNFLGGTGVSPVRAQAKACGYQILSLTIFGNPKIWV